MSRGSLVSYRIGRPPSSVVCPSVVCSSSTLFKHLLLRNHWADWSQISYGVSIWKFVQTVLVTWPRWPPCPYMVKNLKKSSSPEPKGWWPWNLVCSIGCSSTTKFVQMVTLGWPWPILHQGQIWSLMLLYGKKVKQWIFSETIVVYDLKLGTETRSFCWHQNFVPWGLYAPCLGAIYMY